MSDKFDETAQRLGKPLEDYGCRGLKKLLITTAALGCLGLCAITYDLYRNKTRQWPTAVGVTVLFGAAGFAVWRGREKTRGFTVCRHGILLQDQARQTEYMWDEISHLTISRNVNPAERAVALVLIDGKRLEFDSRFWQAEQPGHRQEECVRLLRTYVRDVRRG